MSSCAYTLADKDSNAQYATRIFSASDVTRMIRNQNIRNNYTQLNAKNARVQGGISHRDMYAIAHTAGSYSTAAALTSASYAQCTPCRGVPFQLGLASGVVRPPQ